ncbi:MAG TPA: DUF6498-containing protein, partial [Candidatus Limnocylindrales bacterium]|nr:DUF6498-containing protein [Candidatus Limnocylindrales bacterium]
MIARSVRIAQATSETTSLLVLIGFNLVPLVGVLIGRWSVATLLVLYWVENGIVGILNVPKILLAEGPLLAAAAPLGRRLSAGGLGPAGGLGAAIRIPIAVFFLVHYGIFWLVHGVFVWTLPMFLGASTPPLDPSGFPIGSPLASPGFPLVSTASSVDGSAVFWGAIGLAISHGVSFVVNFLGRGEFRKVSPAEQAGRPYGRVVVLHLAILFGGFVSLAIGSPIGAVLVLVVLKTAIDVVLHRREHDKLAAR